MSSTFIPQPKEYWIKNQIDPVNGEPVPVMAYVQFVPGIVVNTVTGADSVKHAGNQRKVNSIIALPHISNDGIKKQSTAGEEFRHYQLFRGMGDVPVAGDPVLLTKIGGIKYYLGPLNTEGNPNFNRDQFEGTEVNSGYETGVKNEGKNSNPLFPKVNYSRLEKRLNIKLDNPGNWDEENQTMISNAIAGDMIFEGRYGNSLRIGSRNVNPYFIISNGRHYDNPTETSLDGTIMGIFNKGSIRDHFNDTWKEEDEEFVQYPFTLADDEIEDVKRSISKSYNNENGYGRGGIKVKGSDFNVEEAIYDYDENQFFTSSDRITFNARKDSIFLSAFNNIHLGCGSSMTFSTSTNILIEAAESVITNTPLFHINSSGAVFIEGKRVEDENGNKIPSISLGNPTSGDSMHSAVLGEGLISALTMILDEMKSLALATSEAIEGHKATGASVQIMNNIVKGIDDILGKETVEDNVSQESYEYPKKLADMILSDAVQIRK